MAKLPGGAKLGPSFSPQTFPVNVFGFAVANTNWATNTSDAASLYGFRLSSGGSQNDSVTFRMPSPLAAGTWRVDIRGRQSTAQGIFTVQLDDGAGNFSTIATIDSYTSGASTSNVAMSATGIAIAAGGLAGVAMQQLRLIAATKNAASSGFGMSINMLQFTRTA